MGKRQEIRNRRQAKVRRQQRTAIIVVVAAALLVSGFVIVQALRPIGEIKPLTVRDHPQANELAMGNPNAAIVVEEFSDFQCVACFNFWQSMEEEFISKYVATEQVYFKYVPFSFIGEESFQAAEAAYCANEQNSFWPYHDMVFGNWTGENIGNFNNDRLVAFGEEIGLDAGALRSCLTGNKYNSEVQQGVVYGNQNGVSATPSFLVNGQLVYAGELFAKIDELLGQ